MIVRLTKPWKFRNVGHVFNDMPDGQANMLIKRRFAEEVTNAIPDQQAGANDSAYAGAGAGNTGRSQARTVRRSGGH